MNIPNEELRRRREVWFAVSRLWLDTKHDEDSLEAIADVLRRSKYRTEELGYIFKYEVTPVVWYNLIGIGEWQGFDAKWLEQRIVKNMQRNILIRKVINAAASWISRSVNKDWQKVIAKVESKK